MMPVSGKNSEARMTKFRMFSRKEQNSDINLIQNNVATSGTNNQIVSVDRNLMNSSVISRRRENTVSILERTRKNDTSMSINKQAIDTFTDSEFDRDEQINQRSTSNSNLTSARHLSPSILDQKYSQKKFQRFSVSETRHQQKQDIQEKRRKNINPMLQKQLQDYLTLKKIFEVEVADDKFEERRVVMLKAMLRIKERENMLLKQMLKKKEDAFLRSTELCAFFSQVLCTEYLDKRETGQGEPLGRQLKKKDTRKIQTSLAWKEVIDDQQFNNVERRILQEMSYFMALPILSKSTEDIKAIRKSIVTRLCEEDESFARQYFMSLMKEIKYINKKEELRRQNDEILRETVDLFDLNLRKQGLSQNTQQQLSSRMNNFKQSATITSKGLKTSATPNQLDTIYQSPQPLNTLQYSAFNYETLMRIESELYTLFRFLLKFLKNDSFLEYYQNLLNLKKGLNSTLQTLFEFSIVAGTQERFADTKQQAQFYNKINQHLFAMQRNTNNRSSTSQTDDTSILSQIHRKVYLSKDKITKILDKSHHNKEYLSKSLSKIRVMEIQNQLKISCLESELQLQANCNTQIEQRLNSIDETSLGKIQHLQRKLKSKVFDPLRELSTRIHSKTVILDLQETLSNVFKAERQIYGEEQNQKKFSGIDKNSNGQTPNPKSPQQSNYFDKINSQLVHKIQKLKNYLINFDKMFADVCTSSDNKSVIDGF